MLTTYQILNGFINIDITDFFDLSTLHIHGVTHVNFTLRRHTRYDVRKGFFKQNN